MTAPVTVRILDKDYQVACREDEQDALLSAARLVNTKMKELRDRGNVIGTDRLAVITALNIANELLELKGEQSNYDGLVTRIRELSKSLERALERP